MLKSYKWMTLLLAILLGVAWGISWLVPDEQRTRYQTVVKELPSACPVAEVIATVHVRLGVRLMPSDVAVWRSLQAQGRSAEEALYIVVSYRKAQGSAGVN